MRDGVGDVVDIVAIAVSMAAIFVNSSCFLSIRCPGDAHSRFVVAVSDVTSMFSLSRCMSPWSSSLLAPYVPDACALQVLLAIIGSRSSKMYRRSKTDRRFWLISLGSRRSACNICSSVHLEHLLSLLQTFTHGGRGKLFTDPLHMWCCYMFCVILFASTAGFPMSNVHLASFAFLIVHVS